MTSDQIEATQSALINASLERLGEQDVDLTDRIYARFERDCPAGMEALRAATHVARGRMLAEILHAFAAQAEHGPMTHAYMQEEAVTHAALGISLPIHAALFDAIIGCVAEALGPDWNAATENAWRARAQSMLGSLDSGLGIVRRAVHTESTPAASG